MVGAAPQRDYGARGWVSYNEINLAITIEDSGARRCRFPSVQVLNLPGGVLIHIFKPHGRIFSEAAPARRIDAKD